MFKGDNMSGNKKNNKTNSRTISKILTLVIVLLIGYIGFLKNKEYENRDFGVNLDNQLLKYFQKQFPDNEVQKVGIGDIDNDGTEDLVVIYKKKDEDANEMREVFNRDGHYKISNEHRAPYENQRVEFKDIDNSPPQEFIITGSRNGRYGHNIYRYEGYDEVHSIFGQDMDAC